MQATRKHAASVVLADDWPSDYADQFWNAYPHKVGKKAALHRLAQVRKQGIGFAQLLAGLAHYIDTKPQDRPWCNPLTWLNQGRWDDQPAIHGGRGETEFQRAQRETREILDVLARSGDEGSAADFGMLPGDNRER